MSLLTLSDTRLAALLRRQDGVVSRCQLICLDLQPHEIARLLRRRELAQAFPGVYVNHTGPLTPRQREWVAVLTAWPAALTGASALPEISSGTIQLAVGRGRKLQLPPGVRIRRADDLESRVEWQRQPPRVRVEHAILDLMSDKILADDVAGAFHALTQVAHSRRTTADRILAALDERPRLSGRALIRGLLHDLRDGACSVLEREYLHRVERAHGLPAADRQRASRATGTITLLDVPYPEFGLIVELDGRFFHSGAQADTDAFRDLAEMADGDRPTLRVTYGLVFGTPCRTAHALAAVLQRRGWQGTMHTCYRCHPRRVA